LLLLAQAARNSNSQVGFSADQRRVRGSRFEMANGRTVRQVGSNIDPLCDTQCIFEFDAQISNSAVDLCVAKQQLDGSEIASFAMYFRSLSSAQRVSAVTARL
jgi:hypothetical protein